MLRILGGLLASLAALSSHFLVSSLRPKQRHTRWLLQHAAVRRVSLSSAYALPTDPSAHRWPGVGLLQVGSLEANLPSVPGWFSAGLQVAKFPAKNQPAPGQMTVGLMRYRARWGTLWSSRSDQHPCWGSTTVLSGCQGLQGGRGGLP